MENLLSPSPQDQAAPLFFAVDPRFRHDPEGDKCQKDHAFLQSPFEPGLAPQRHAWAMHASLENEFE